MVTNAVLVHGAWADGSSWSGVIRRLQDGGCQAIAVQLPLTSFGDDVAVTRRAIALRDGPIVLAGHSYGGMVISEAANNAPNVASLVYISAFANEEGEMLGEINARIAPAPGPTPLRFNDAGFVWVDQEAFPRVFAHDVDPAQTRVMAAVQKPIAAKIFGEKPGKPAWKSIPSWYLISEDDRMIPAPLQKFMANRMGAISRTVPGSHASLVSHAEEAAQLILDAAKAAAGGAATKKAVPA